MQKINTSNIEKLKLSKTIFKYPVQSKIVENLFSPSKNKDFEKYMVTKIENEEIRLSKEEMFLHEGTDTITINETEVVDGKWWILP